MFRRKIKKATFVAEIEEEQGEMLEWLKRHAWKACIRQKCIGGSNPPLSAYVCRSLQIEKHKYNFFIN